MRKPLPLPAFLGASALILLSAPLQAQITTLIGGRTAQDGVGVMPKDDRFLVAARDYTGSAYRGLSMLCAAGSEPFSTTELSIPGSAFVQGLVQTTDGGAYIVGSHIPPGASQHDGVVVRLNADNQVLWMVHPDVIGNEQYFAGAVLPDGGLVACGTVNGTSGHDVIVSRFSATGELAWSTVAPGDLDAEAYAIALDATGVMITGRQVNFGGTTDALFMRLSMAGTVEWTATWGGEGYEAGRALVRMANGTFVIAGMTDSYGPYDHTEHRIKDQVYLIGIDVTGDTLWTEVIGDTIHDRGAWCMTVAVNGELLIGGERFTPGESDAMAIRASATGATIWQRTFDTGKEERFLAICNAPGGFAATGWSFGSQARQVLLVKRGDDGD